MTMPCFLARASRAPSSVIGSHDMLMSYDNVIKWGRHMACMRHIYEAQRIAAIVHGLEQAGNR
jgi:hypothetical protein